MNYLTSAIRPLVVASVVALVALTGACGSNEDVNGASPSNTAGSTFDASGDAFDEGTGGTNHGGSGGAGGASGKGGQAGSAGQPSTGGQAGQAGSGGNLGGAAGQAGSGGSVGGAAGQAGAGGATGQAGAGGATGPEDCLNSLDDNGDGLIDCADPKCQADYECVPSPVGGWSTSQYRVGRIDAETSADCPAAFEPAVALYDLADLVEPPADCSCSCETPTGGGCSSDVSCWGNKTCTGTPSTTVTLFGSSCKSVGYLSIYDACMKTPEQVLAGTCKSKAAVAQVAPWSWSEKVRMCEFNTLQAGKCSSSGESCVPRIQGSQQVCYRTAATCKSPYTKLTTLYDGKGVDHRGCSATGCQCGPEQGATCVCMSTPCPVQLFWNNYNCSTLSVGGAQENTCSSVNFNPSGTGTAMVPVTFTEGACEASGAGTATGQVDPSGPIELCCLP